MTVSDLLRRLTCDFEHAGLPTPRLDAEVIVMHALRADRVVLYRNPEIPVPQAAEARIDGWAERRQKGEPVAYLVGEKEFWSRSFAVSPAVLIPRPETEHLIEEVLLACRENLAPLLLLEVGTGSGAVAVTLALELPQSRIVATDISLPAIALARKNAERHGAADRIRFIVGDGLDFLSGSFDVILSNPPYISAADYDRLPGGVRDFEPRRALLAGEAGTDFHRRLAEDAVRLLCPGGRLIVEVGNGQAEDVLALIAAVPGYDDGRTRSDYGGERRVVCANRKH